MRKQPKSKLVGVRFRDRKGHFTKPQAGIFSKGESYDKRTFKTLIREKRFSQKIVLPRKIGLIKRSKIPTPALPIPIPPEEIPLEARKNWRVIIEFICSPPNRELRVMNIINKTVAERDSLISERTTFYEQELGCGISNITIEELPNEKIVTKG